MSAQSDNIVESCVRYASDVSKRHNFDLDTERAIQAAYLSGVMASSMALAAGDGIHPSRLVEACREAGMALLGIKSEPIT